MTRPAHWASLNRSLGEDSVASHNRPGVVDPERFRAVRAGEVKRDEDAFAQQEAVPRASNEVAAQDRASVGDVLGDGFGGARVVYGSESAVAEQETVIVRTSHRVESDNLALAVDPPGFRDQRAREVERGKRAAAQDEPVLDPESHDPMAPGDVAGRIDADGEGVVRPRVVDWGKAILGEREAVERAICGSVVSDDIAPSVDVADDRAERADRFGVIDRGEGQGLGPRLRLARKRECRERGEGANGDQMRLSDRVLLHLHQFHAAVRSSAGIGAVIGNRLVLAVAHGGEPLG